MGIVVPGPAVPAYERLAVSALAVSALAGDRTAAGTRVRDTSAAEPPWMNYSFAAAAAVSA